MIHVGTSGWCYKHWRDNFYQRDEHAPLISVYSKQFSSVEINNSFYRLPTSDTFKKWLELTPDNFTFSVKSPRFITHIKKLISAPEYTELFFKNISELKHKLGPILFQLPPNMKCNLERLESFIYTLPKGPRYVFEFRHESWNQIETFRALRRHGVHYCVHDIGIQWPEVMVNGVAYVRFHGSSERYGGGYSDEALQSWALKLSVWSMIGNDVFCYFNNDGHGWAPKNALTLKRYLAELSEPQ